MPAIMCIPGSIIKLTRARNRIIIIDTSKLEGNILAMKSSNTSKQTICARGAINPDTLHGAVVPPIYQNSLFSIRNTGGSPFVYSRVSNPTVDFVEKGIAKLENADRAACFSSGMAAISSAILSRVKGGDHIIFTRNIYGGTRSFIVNYLSRFGITHTLIDGRDPDELQAAVQPNSTLFYFESPTSFLLTLLPIPELVSVSRRAGLSTIIDNTWASPIYQNPLDLGVDLVVHSASKYLGGHSDLIAGVVAGSDAFMEKLVNEERTTLGGCIDPHQAWLLGRGIRTLAVRMKQHRESAMQVAQFLSGHEAVGMVYYPELPGHEGRVESKAWLKGSSGVLSFQPKGGNDVSQRIVRALRMFEVGPSWGGFESMSITPGFGMGIADAAFIGIPENLIRLSIGLEDPEELVADLEQALEQR